MQITRQLSKYAVLGVVIAGLGLVLVQFFDTGKKVAGVDVRIPEFSALAIQGKEAFNANCAQCHGKNASGTGNGPPLVHKIYNPGHHSDRAFFIAMKRGVRRHHWRYGNMPPQPQIKGDQMAAIVKYVRELQVANGIMSPQRKM